MVIAVAFHRIVTLINRNTFFDWPLPKSKKFLGVSLKSFWSTKGQRNGSLSVGVQWTLLTENSFDVSKVCPSNGLIELLKSQKYWLIFPTANNGTCCSFRLVFIFSLFPRLVFRLTFNLPFFAIKAPLALYSSSVAERSPPVPPVQFSNLNSFNYQKGAHTTLIKARLEANRRIAGCSARASSFGDHTPPAEPHQDDSQQAFVKRIQCIQYTVFGRLLSK